ncbi:hypothetical protein ACRALDRAFT_1030416 [Sodiomyces alcalophilus JCM 7366]|uniref:uncharacterized protein n=1 Tax=Sodiomyces alcalophilus JCM 7366 TaxID=591952 RepID=UPI0039B4A1C1
MADRFPSLEEFDSVAQTDITPVGRRPSTEDFIAREKALLGNDAERFSGPSGHATYDVADDILAGDNEDLQKSTSASDIPNLTREQDAVGFEGNNTESSVEFNSGSQTAVEEEPEVSKEWRKCRDAQIRKRAELFASQRHETIKEAQQHIDGFYDNYNTKKEKSVVQTRKDVDQFLASREDTASGGTSWERIAKLVDVSGKGNKGGAAGSGKERFRELLVNLKKDTRAPGAEGY